MTLDSKRKWDVIRTSLQSRAGPMSSSESDEEGRQAQTSNVLLPDGTTVEAYTQRLVGSVVAATKAANELPLGADHAFHMTNGAYRQTMGASSAPPALPTARSPLELRIFSINTIFLVLSSNSFDCPPLSRVLLPPSLGPRPCPPSLAFSFPFRPWIPVLK